ncbi:MAG: 7-cyano-7-deazaguanine synthase QueC [Phycisphaeraceae bacterium]|nr:MAG: 7-cyano-7-deazaguanine synthase QueC [Phycisphaeraceae bacterium]
MPPPPTATDPPAAVVLVSGGLDSAVALATARAAGAACHALTFDYGQRHRVELEAARKVSEQLGATRHVLLSIDLRAFGGSALTSDTIDVPKQRAPSGAETEIPVTYVPARNLVFLSLATALAETIGASDIYIGVNAVDYSGYPDCRPAFIEAFARCADLATKAGAEGGRLRIRTPLMEMSKAEIIRAGADLGVDFSLTHSCYDPDERGRACGGCDSCVIRRAGFEASGVEDPTIYAA